jgi:hypothetical protein
MSRFILTTPDLNILGVHGLLEDKNDNKCPGSIAGRNKAAHGCKCIGASKSGEQ